MITGNCVRLRNCPECARAANSTALKINWSIFLLLAESLNFVDVITSVHLFILLVLRLFSRAHYAGCLLWHVHQTW